MKRIARLEEAQVSLQPRLRAALTCCVAVAFPGHHWRPRPASTERRSRCFAPARLLQVFLVGFLEGCLSLGFGSEEKFARFIEMKPGDRLDREAKVE